MNNRWFTRRDLLATSGLAITGLALPRDASSQSLGHATSRIRARLSLNENPFGPSPLALQAIKDRASEVFRYTDEASAVLLAQEIAAVEKVSAEQILLGELLEPLGMQLAMEGGAGGEFVYSTPGYTALVDSATPLGGIARPVPLDTHLQNDLPGISAAVNSRTRTVFIVNPHNPTGTVSDAETFHRFLSETSRRTLVIVDEAYLDFMQDFAARTAVSHTRNGEDVIVFRTFGKLYGLAGLQMGYAVAPLKRAQQLKQRGLGFYRSLSSLGVAAASASLRDKTFAAEARNKVSAERQQWHSMLDRIKARRTDAQGNFVFFETKRPHKLVAEALLREGIEIGRAFDPYSQWVRISIGLPEENKMARNAVKKLLESAL
jgi:histidinol-phosphate aminotransferase